MSVKVIDASAVTAILFNEQEADRVIERIADDALMAPVLMPFEVASVCRGRSVAGAAGRCPARTPSGRSRILNWYSLAPLAFLDSMSCLSQ